MAWVLYTSWRYGQQDPWLLYNGTPAPSPLPARYRYFLMACGLYASKEDVERTTVISGGQVQKATGGLA